MEYNGEGIDPTCPYTIRLAYFSLIIDRTNERSRQLFSQRELLSRDHVFDIPVFN